MIRILTFIAAMLVASGAAQASDFRGECRGHGVNNSSEYTSHHGTNVVLGNIWLNGQWTSHTCAGNNLTPGDDRNIPDPQFYSGHVPVTGGNAHANAYRSEVWHPSRGKICLDFGHNQPDSNLHTSIKDRGTLDARYEGGGWANGRKIQFPAQGLKGIVCSINDVGYLFSDLETGEKFEISIQGITSTGDSHGTTTTYPAPGRILIANHGPHKGRICDINNWDECAKYGDTHAFFAAHANCNNQGKAAVTCYIDVRVVN